MMQLLKCWYLEYYLHCNILQRHLEKLIPIAFLRRSVSEHSEGGAAADTNNGLNSFLAAISTQICDTQTFVSLSEQKGYIVGQTGGPSSRVSVTRCTFAIEVDPGQRVALYMYR